MRKHPQCQPPGLNGTFSATEPCRDGRIRRGAPKFLLLRSPESIQRVLSVGGDAERDAPPVYLGKAAVQQPGDFDVRLLAQQALLLVSPGRWVRTNPQP